MNPQNIEQFQEFMNGRFRDTANDALQIFESENPSLFNSRPEPGKWSMAQHLHHLNVTGTLYLEQIKETLPENRNSPLKGEVLNSFKPRLLTRKFIEALEPPAKRTFKAPRVFQPAQDLDMDVVLPNFLALQEDFIHCLETVVHNHLLKVKITSPASGILKLQLGEAFLVNIAHQHRHLWHCEEIKEEKT